MANWLHRTTKQELRSVSSASLPEPQANYIENPDLSAVVGWPNRYWLVTGDVVSLVDQATRDSIDAALLLLLPYAPGISLQIGARVANIAKRHEKTVVAYVPDLNKYEVIIRGFELNGIAVGDTIEEAVQMLNAIRMRSKYLQHVGKV